MEEKEKEKEKALDEMSKKNETEVKCLIATIPCPNCGSYKTLLVNKNAYRAWRKGEILIQDAFPELSKEDRERLLTGICPKCWKELFGDEPDDEDDDTEYETTKAKPISELFKKDK